MSLGLTEILVIFVAILLLFGAKRIPEIARALGRASHEFKKAKDEIINETEELKDAAEKKPLWKIKRVKRITIKKMTPNNGGLPL